MSIVGATSISSSSVSFGTSQSATQNSNRTTKIIFAWFTNVSTLATSLTPMISELPKFLRNDDTRKSQSDPKARGVRLHCRQTQSGKSPSYTTPGAIQLEDGRLRK